MLQATLFCATGDMPTFFPHGAVWHLLENMCVFFDFKIGAHVAISKVPAYREGQRGNTGRRVDCVQWSAAIERCSGHTMSSVIWCIAITCPLYETQYIALYLNLYYATGEI